MRTQSQVCDEIARMSDEERGQLISRIKTYDWPDDRKKSVTTFIMLLGLIDARSRPAQ